MCECLKCKDNVNGAVYKVFNDTLYNLHTDVCFPCYAGLKAFNHQMRFYVSNMNKESLPLHFFIAQFLRHSFNCFVYII